MGSVSNRKVSGSCVNFQGGESCPSVSGVFLTFSIVIIFTPQSSSWLAKLSGRGGQLGLRPCVAKRWNSLCRWYASSNSCWIICFELAPNQRPAFRNLLPFLTFSWSGLLHFPLQVHIWVTICPMAKETDFVSTWCASQETQIRMTSVVVDDWWKIMSYEGEYF